MHPAAAADVVVGSPSVTLIARRPSTGRPLRARKTQNPAAFFRSLFLTPGGPYRRRFNHIALLELLRSFCHPSPLLLRIRRTYVYSILFYLYLHTIGHRSIWRVAPGYSFVLCEEYLSLPISLSHLCC